MFIKKLGVDGFHTRAITHRCVCPWLLRPGAPALPHLHEGTAQQREKSGCIQNSEHLNPYDFFNVAVADQLLWFGFPLRPGCAADGVEFQGF